MRSKTCIAIPPGATIKEMLEDRNMSQKEFAMRMEMSEKHISKLINGDVILTPQTAIRLEMVLGMEAYFWNSLESQYREDVLKVKYENEMDDDIILARKFPYEEMANNGWVEKVVKEPSEKVIQLRKFFEVVSLRLVNPPLLPKIACRKLSKSEKNYYAMVTWAQKVKLEARSIKVDKINVKKLVSKIPNIREMTNETPEISFPAISKILSECGIALVLLPHFEGSFLQGVTFRDGNKIVIGMSTKENDKDKFWFNFFHEIGHIVLGHINKACVIDLDDEKEADEFAQCTLNL